MLDNYELELISNAEKPGLSLTPGTLHLRLKVIDEITSSTVSPRNTGKEAGHSSLTREKTSDIGDFVTNQSSECDDLYQDIGKLLLKLEVFFLKLQGILLQYVSTHRRRSSHILKYSSHRSNHI